MKVVRCKSCDARAVWMVAKGKKAPFLVNAESVTAECERSAAGVPLYDQAAGHVAHFATCPDRDQWRRPR